MATVMTTTAGVMSNALQQENQRWLRSRAWPPRRARWLETEATKDFVEKYLCYRKGYSKGAKGEILDLGAGNVHKSTTMANTQEEAEDYDSDIEQDDEFADMSIFDSVEDAKVATIMRQLENWRRAYRLFRTGSNRGAEGEINRLATVFTKEHFRLLPVAQLASFFAASALQAKQPTPARACTFHCHIGGGRLGCGLVLPMLCASGAPFAVLQVVTPEWVPVMERADKNFILPFTINGDDLCKMRVVRSLDELLATGFAERNPEAPPLSTSSTPPSPAAIAATYRLKPPARGTPQAISCRLLVLDVALQDLFLTQCDALSTALGPGLTPVSKHLAKLLPQHPTGTPSVALYCCENDHKAVAGVRPDLDGRISVRECMVDRICSDRIVEPELVTVVAEPYPGEIVVTARDSQTIRPGFGGPCVHLPTSSAAYSYLYSRKVLLVNGSHTTLAFMTLRRSCPGAAEAPGDYELLTPSALSANEQTELRAWLTARCLVLLHSNEIVVMKGVHAVATDDALIRDLWTFASRTARRFDTVKDTTKRVLGGGVANRYETRLKDVLTTLETFDRSVPLAGLLLAASGFESVRQVVGVLRQLVNDAAIFVA